MTQNKIREEEEENDLIAKRFAEQLPWLVAGQVSDLRERREKLASKFVKLNEKAFKDIEGQIGRNLLHIVKLHMLSHSINTWEFHECISLIDHSIKMTLTCVDLFRELRFYEGIILSRTLIETCATALVLKSDEKELALFLNHQFNSSKAIKKSKKYIPEIAVLWGEISNVLIHINTRTHGAQKLKADDSTISIQATVGAFDFFVPEKSTTSILLGYLELMNYLIQACIELIFLRRVSIDGFEGYIYPNNTTFVIGQRGIDLFSKKLNELKMSTS